VVTSLVACHASVLEQDFHRGGGKTDIHLFFDQLVGDAVVVVVNLDMVINTDPGLFPFSIFIGT